MGSITEFGNETKNRNIGGGGGGFGGFGIGGIGHKESKANVMLDARLVDIDTAEILGVAEGKGESKRSSTSLLGGGGNWHGFRYSTLPRSETRLVWLNSFRGP